MNTLLTTVEIYGNFRDRQTSEWAGTGTLSDGSIECSADCGDDVYEAIEGAIADGETSGTVEAESGVTYEWSAK